MRGFLQTLKAELLYDPQISFLEKKKKERERDTNLKRYLHCGVDSHIYLQQPIHRNHLSVYSADEWIKKRWCVEYYSAIKKE